MSATPYIYLVPAGVDAMRSPPLGDLGTVRTWAVDDQAIPLPFNIGETDFSTNNAFLSGDSLSEDPFAIRKHQAFRAVPAGRHVVKICRAEACQAVGGRELATATLAALGTEWHGTTANGAVTVEPVYCLGLCANGPAAMVDGRPIAAATAERLAREVSA